MPLVDDGVVLHPRIAALPRGLGNLPQQVAGLVLLHGMTALHATGPELAVILGGGHKFVGHADGIVGVLEKDGAVSLGVGAGAVVSHLNQRPGLGFFLGFALDKVNDVGMVDVENDHLGGAARLAAGLDHAGK